MGKLVITLKKDDLLQIGEAKVMITKQSNKRSKLVIEAPENINVNVKFKKDLEKQKNLPDTEIYEQD